MVLYTIGYHRRTLPELRDILRKYGVRFLIDIRQTSASVIGFDSGSLERLMRSRMNFYYRFARLGVPGTLRRQVKALPPSEWLAALEADYEKILDNNETSLRKLKDLITANEGRCCLLCLEFNHETCHRTLLASRLEKMIPGLIVEHL